MLVSQSHSSCYCLLRQYFSIANSLCSLTKLTWPTLSKHEYGSAKDADMLLHAYREIKLVLCKRKQITTCF